MKKPLTQSLQLAEQRNALSMYLDALLTETRYEEDGSCVELDLFLDEQASDAALPPALSNAVTSTGANAPPAPQNPETISATVPTAEAGILFDSKASTVDLSIPPQAIQYGDLKPVSGGGQNSTSSGEVSKSNKEQNEPPHWALPSFQALTFSLNRLQIATPLEKLNGIIPLPGHITELPGQSPWFLGIIRSRNQNVHLVDLERIIKPVRGVGGNTGNGEVQNHAAQATKYILLLDEGRWGILCDSIGTVLTFEPQQVIWRRFTRFDWFVGTVREKMLAVLDVECLVKRLNGRSI